MFSGLLASPVWFPLRIVNSYQLRRIISPIVVACSKADLTQAVCRSFFEIIGVFAVMSQFCFMSDMLHACG